MMGGINNNSNSNSSSTSNSSSNSSSSFSSTAAIPHQHPTRRMVVDDDNKYGKASRARWNALWNSVFHGRSPAAMVIVGCMTLLIILLLFGGGDDDQVTGQQLVSSSTSGAAVRVINDRFGRPLTIPAVPQSPNSSAVTGNDGSGGVSDSTTAARSAISSAELMEERKQAVIRAYQHSWAGYKQFAFGQDLLHPLTQTGTDWFGMALTLIDGLDTAYLMGLNAIVVESRQFVMERLRFDHPGDSNVFEVTIRVLGALLAMHHLTGDGLYLKRAQELADKMLVAFDTQNGVPLASVDFSRAVAVPAPDGGSSTSEAATLQLEWRYLAVLTGETKYWRVAERIMDVIANSTESDNRIDGLVPIYISHRSSKDTLFVGNNYRLGSRGDSYYEYLAKQWLQTGRKEDRYRRMFEEAMVGVLKRLVRRSWPNGLEFIGELQQGIDGSLTPKMDHLVCFLPGTLALFVTQGRRLPGPDAMAQLSPKHQEYLRFAQSLLYTCYQMYRSTATGLAPEIVYFNIDAGNDQPDILIKPLDGHNLLRPETVESLFLLYRLTGNQTYREWGWEIFQSFEKYCRVPSGGYSTLKDVRQAPPVQSDNMETFWVGETLKYFYLLFEDDSKLPLEKYIINTEAHPFPVLDEILSENFRKKLQAEGLGRFTAA